MRAIAPKTAPNPGNTGGVADDSDEYWEAQLS